MKTTFPVRIWVQQVPVTHQVFWCLTFTIALVLCFAAAIALWRWGVVGGIIIGFALARLLSA
jgi:ABC-type uncharacterized transport system permease subunit